MPQDFACLALERVKLEVRPLDPNPMHPQMRRIDLGVLTSVFRAVVDDVQGVGRIPCTLAPSEMSLSLNAWKSWSKERSRTASEGMVVVPAQECGWQRDQLRPHPIL